MPFDKIKQSAAPNTIQAIYCRRLLLFHTVAETKGVNPKKLGIGQDRFYKLKQKLFSLIPRMKIIFLLKPYIFANQEKCSKEMDPFSAYFFSK